MDQLDRRLDLDLHPAIADHDALKACVNVCQGGRALAQAEMVDIDVHRKPGHVAMEQLDRDDPNQRSLLAGC